ncbi:MAG: hypothetical protein U0176_06450 [Bacteroidia bacterium]
MNGIYGIEQELVNPNPFRIDGQKVDYSDPLFNDMFIYNRLHSWKYSKIVEVMGGEGRTVNTVAELTKVLEEIRKDPKANFVVAVSIPEDNAPGSLQHHLVNTSPGEDEIPNPAWPPYLVY